MKPFVIWEPKYKAKSVLVDCLKVKKGKNYLFFCMLGKPKDDDDYAKMSEEEKIIYDNPDGLFSFDGENTIKESSIIFNSKIYCYAVPYNKLTLEGPIPEKYLDTKKKGEEEYRRNKMR